MDHARTRPRRPTTSAAPRTPHLRGAWALAALSAVILVGAFVVPAVATAASPRIAASPTIATAGSSVTVSGTGFAKRQSGSVLFDDGSWVAFRANGRGSFTVALDVASDTTPGEHGIVATDRDSGAVLTATSVDVVSVTAPSPTVAPSPTAAAPTPTAEASGPTLAAPSPTLAPSPAPAAYTFTDEFDGASLDPVWGTSAHWTNLSEAVADRTQSTVANGILTIAAVRTSSGWKSDLIDTWGRWTQKYGYFEARMKFTAGYGAWPAFWLAEDWTSGHTNELDINETLANPVGGSRGDTSQRYYATVHYDSPSTGKWSSGSYAYNAPQDLADAWHVYAMDWRPDHITFYVDGVAWKTFTDASHIPSVAMPVVFNLAMGGWAGATTSTTPSPSYLHVDWVRVRA